MAPTAPQLIFGGGGFNAELGFDAEKLAGFLDAIADVGINHIDTAQVYGTSEELLGEAKAASRFTIATKFPGGLFPTPWSKDSVVQAGQQSLKKLQTDSVEIYYQHTPSPNTPLEETLAGIDALYKAGAFKHFGLSNFSSADVDKVVNVAKEHGYVVPTVYQGNYNAFSRHIEADLFPTLRRHGIAFNAYSPSAGGFLAKSSDVLRKGAGSGRWDSTNLVGRIYTSLYSKPLLLDGLDTWNEIAKSEGITGIEMAYRWIAYHSKLQASLGDGVIIGARDVDQLRQNVAWIKKGPLSADAAKKIDKIWETIKSEAPVDNFNSFKGLIL